MTLELRTPVALDLPDRTVEGEIRGVTHRQPVLYDVFEPATREWHKGLTAEQLTRRNGA